MMQQGPSVGWSSGRPTVIQPSAYRSTGNGGIDCMCCTCCPCVNLGFLRTKAGWLKIMELETIFNCLACILYLLSSSHLSWAVQTWLWPQYRITPYYTVYPAMTACYVLGLVLGIMHGIDAWLAYRNLKGRP
ncbi:protein singles bar-like [Penaeus japonicus]|uniref:protein singles bar-like n=1 Tax=Penaeus japonicus TaxID=27405 RepID=UPI001C70E729|nr:protein singles bar-like [Penaeus japonicus]